MSKNHEGSVVRLPVQFWYDIPQGYLQLDVHPTAERMDALAKQIRVLPEPLRSRADQLFRLYAVVMWEMQKLRVQGCALGMHPDDQGGATTSVLTLSSVAMPGVNPKAVLTTLMASGSGGSPDNGIVPVELPCGPAFLSDTVRHTMAPGAPSEGTDGQSEAPVWQGMVAIPDTRSAAAIVVQLVTSSVELADDYRGVLLGVARTVSFTDPRLADGASETEKPKPGANAEAVRSDFG